MPETPPSEPRESAPGAGTPSDKRTSASRSRSRKTGAGASSTKGPRSNKKSAAREPLLIGVAYQSKDIALKVVADALRGDILARFQPDLPAIVAALPSEVPSLRIETEETDLLFQLADGSTPHIEFQTTMRVDDLGRFLGYHLAAHARYGKPVTTVIFYGAGITSAPPEFNTSQCVFRPRIVLLGNEDGASVLRELREKVARGETLTRDDQVQLIFLPLMRQEQGLGEILPEAARLSEALPVETREMTVGALLGLAYHRVDAAVITAILKEMGMQSVLEQLLDYRWAQMQEEFRQQKEEEFRQQQEELRQQQEDFMARLTEEKAQVEARLTEEKAQAEARLAEEKAQAEARLAEEKAQAEARLAEEKAQAEAQGQVEGKQASLRTVLQTRFGTIPEMLETRIASAGSDDLDAMMAHAVKVESVESF